MKHNTRGQQFAALGSYKRNFRTREQRRRDAEFARQLEAVRRAEPAMLKSGIQLLMESRGF